MTKDALNKRYETRLVCQTCHLVFLREEAGKHAGRYSRYTRRCARCQALAQEKAGKLDLPECWGRSYDARSPICLKKCTLQHACLIQYCDLQTVAWEWQFPRRQRREVIPYEDDLTRLFRLCGKPLHVKDVTGLLEKINPQYEMWDDPDAHYLENVLRDCEQIVDLGKGFHVWIGVWRPEE